MAGTKMLIGLTGLKGSGKDTVAAHLVKEHNFERRAFADILKKSVAALYGIPFSEIETWKNDERVYAQLTREVKIDHDKGSFLQKEYMSQMTFRELLQRYGTEAHREIFGHDFWVDALLPVGGYYAGRDIVISDCRYRSEFERVEHLRGFVVRVDRPALGPNQDPHSSETELLDWASDYVLENDGTVEDLFINVEVMLTELVNDT